MTRFIDKILENIPQDVFSETELQALFPGTPDHRYGRIKRAIAREDLVRVRRGLYGLGKKYRRRPLNLFALANRIYGPSYISLESFLAQHGWIPEAVPAISSATQKHSRNFQTPHGVFIFLRTPSQPLYAGVERLTSEDGTYFMAKPWKALAA